VYLAQIQGEQSFSRWVALKVVHPEQAGDPSFATMLADEARLIARIHHPNVCSVIDFGRHGEQLYLVMEYLHGETLSAVSKRTWKETRSFPAWIAARSVADAARGLDAAHELRDKNGHSLDLVHRDITPTNILISYDGLSKVIDFGVVRARGRQTETQVGTVKGKLTHMAPEQLLGHDVDRRTDVWTLGVTIWETTLGRKLFKGESPAETVRNVVHGPIPRPSEIAPNYPPALEKVVMAALRRDVTKRTPTARAVAHGLETYLYGLGTPTGHAEVARWMRKVFNDRLIVRDALLDAPEDSGLLDIDGLRDDQTESKLVGGPVGSASFAAPARDLATGITQVEEIEVEVEFGDKASRSAPTVAPPPKEPESLEDNIDRTLTDLREGRRRRANALTALVILILLAAGALAWFLAQGGP
jgi:serine/threonine-protein kinase